MAVEDLDVWIQLCTDPATGCCGCRNLAAMGHVGISRISRISRLAAANSVMSCCFSLFFCKFTCCHYMISSFFLDLLFLHMGGPSRENWSRFFSNIQGRCHADSLAVGFWSLGFDDNIAGRVCCFFFTQGTFKTYETKTYKNTVTTMNHWKNL